MASHTNYNAFANDAEALAWARAFASRSSSNNQPTTSSSSTQQNQQTTNGSQGYQTNMQIVLQPAGDDSEEGGGRDDEDAGRKMACERCKKIKVKCEYPSGVKTCGRCAKMGLTCIPGKPKERKVRPQLSAYDQVMDVGSSK